MVLDQPCGVDFTVGKGVVECQGDGEGVVECAEGVAEDVVSCVGKLLPYVVGKTGAKGEQGRPMADAQLRRLDRYWGR